MRLDAARAVVSVSESATLITRQRVHRATSITQPRANTRGLPMTWHPQRCSDPQRGVSVNSTSA